MPQFILKIDLGNTHKDPEIRNRRIALYVHDTFVEMQKNNFEPNGDIRDIKGNTVGYYEVMAE